MKLGLILQFGRRIDRNTARTGRNGVARFGRQRPLGARPLMGMTPRATSALQRRFGREFRQMHRRGPPRAECPLRQNPRPLSQSRTRRKLGGAGRGSPGAQVVPHHRHRRDVRWQRRIKRLKRRKIPNVARKSLRDLSENATMFRRPDPTPHDRPASCRRHLGASGLRIGQPMAAPPRPNPDGIRPGPFLPPDAAAPDARFTANAHFKAL